MTQDNQVMNDNFKIIYKILSIFEKSLDIEDFDLETISAKRLEISEVRRRKYLEMLLEADYISGITIQEDIGGFDIIAENPRITLKGLEYLSENSIMQRMYKTAKGKDIVK